MNKKMFFAIQLLSFISAHKLSSELIDLNKITTEEERRSIGLDSLNEQQRCALQTWVTEWTKTILDQSSTYHRSQTAAQWVNELPKHRISKNLNDEDQSQVIEALKKENKKIFRIKNDGEIIELEDGSIWIASPFDRFMTKNWQRGDVVDNKKTTNVIRPYRLFNATRRENADAELKNPPSSSGKKEEDPTAYYLGSSQVTDVNYKGRSITLKTGATWVISPGDQPRVSKWKINDRIKVKKNSNSIYQYDVENLDSGEKVLANSSEATLSRY